VRTLLAVLALVLTLSACGDDDDPISSGGADEKPDDSSTTASETTATADVPEGPEVCELATEADVETAFAEDLGSGSFSSGSTDEDGVQWQSDNCNWEVDEGTEVSLEVSTAEDFADGQLQCPELDSFDVPSTPVEGLDAEASWVTDKIDPDEGTLRICTDTYLLGIDIESPDGSRDPDTMRDQSVAFAEVVLGNLG
jgi:hypothetical protein